eukprot:829589-Pelagomonas_calceolata.AAC.5
MGGGEASAALCGANLKEEMTVRKFTTDQYAASGLQMHPYMTPAETHPAFTCAHKVLSCVLAAALVISFLAALVSACPYHDPLQRWKKSGFECRTLVQSCACVGFARWRHASFCALPFLLAQVKKQPDGKLTVVMTAKDGSKVEIADNDHVLMATGV